jgi:hypothetical protein
MVVLFKQLVTFNINFNLWVSSIYIYVYRMSIHIDIYIFTVYVYISIYIVIVGWILYISTYICRLLQGDVSFRVLSLGAGFYMYIYIYGEMG